MCGSQLSLDRDSGRETWKLLFFFVIGDMFGELEHQNNRLLVKTNIRVVDISQDGTAGLKDV